MSVECVTLVHLAGFFFFFPEKCFVTVAYSVFSQNPILYSQKNSVEFCGGLHFFYLKLLGVFHSLVFLASLKIGLSGSFHFYLQIISYFAFHNNNVILCRYISVLRVSK